MGVIYMDSVVYAWFDSSRTEAVDEEFFEHVHERVVGARVDQEGGRVGVRAADIHSQMYTLTP